MATDVQPLAPGNVNASARPQPPESRVQVASQWKLMWWKFRRHKAAMIGAVITILIYLVVLFAEFLAPFDTERFSAQHTYAPPQPLHLFETDATGTRFNPYVNGYTVEIDQVALRRTFVVDETSKYYVNFFVEGAPYKLLGFYETNIHLIAPEDPTAPMYLLGADRLGRDLFSRMILGTRISMTIGLVGVAMSFVFGILLGGISGFYSGATDNLIQRVIEFIRSIPQIPLLMALAAAVPTTWSVQRTYFMITVILAFVGWTGLARVIRGRFLAMRAEDFVLAARLDGSPELRTIWKHMVPSFFSHIIASLTLAVPGMIISETALSFLGLGLRAPAVSWGVLLQEAQNIRSVATAPWLMIPALAVIVTVLSLNFLGDGLRDAADPYR